MMNTPTMWSKINANLIDIQKKLEEGRQIPIRTAKRGGKHLQQRQCRDGDGHQQQHQRSRRLPDASTEDESIKKTQNGERYQNVDQGEEGLLFLSRLIYRQMSSIY